MNCKKCGTEIIGESQFCSKCGKPTSSNANEEISLFKQAMKEKDLVVIIGSIFTIISMFILIMIGFRLVTLRSISGDSIAEVYYQCMGYFMFAFAFFIGVLAIYNTARLLYLKKGER